MTTHTEYAQRASLQGTPDGRNFSTYAKTRTYFVLAVAFQIVMLLGTAAPKMYALHYGRTVHLRTSPVDPYDLFRGNYVTLNYDISRIKTKKSFDYGEKVYVTLQPEGEYWKAADVVLQKPSSGLALQGEAQSHGQDGILHVDYKMDRFYVPDGTGKKLEKSKHLDVEVAIDAWSNGIVKSAKPAAD